MKKSRFYCDLNQIVDCLIFRDVKDRYVIILYCYLCMDRVDVEIKIENSL